ncbi:MAG TPA: PEP-CTERM sorting domain-containing protein [Plasticicumulans sp.]|nr:PEP-CTERM sorting domain-containing protein [Plasticicumulans sp.]
MKHFTYALALAGLLGLNAGAHAAIVSVDVDRFEEGFQNIQDTILDSAPVTDTVSLSPANGVATSRTVAINVLSYSAGATNQLTVTADPTVSLLDVINEVGEDSEVRVSWVIPASLIPNDAFNTFFRIAVLQSDGNDLSVEFLLNGTALGNFAVPGNTFNQDLLFTASAAQINAGGTLEMIINGQAGWDADFDDIGFAYETPTAAPEPVSLALFGAGLIGMRRLRRRAIPA